MQLKSLTRLTSGLGLSYGLGLDSVRARDYFSRALIGLRLAQGSARGWWLGARLGIRLGFRLGLAQPR